MIDLYTSPTPNGWKASIALEELALPYSVHPIALQKLEQKQDWYVKIPFAIDRYHRECRRLFEILDKQLEGKEYLTGEYSIADIANWSWVHIYPWSGVEVDGLDNLKRWLDTVGARPAVERGRLIPQASAPPAEDEVVDSARKILV